MTEPAAERDLERRADSALCRLRGSHVGAHGDVHADEPGRGGEHRPDQEAEGHPPAEVVPEPDADEEDGGDAQRSSCTGGAGTRRRRPGRRARSPACAPSPAGSPSSQTVSQTPQPIPTPAQTSAKRTLWSWKKSLTYPRLRSVSQSPRLRRRERGGIPHAMRETTAGSSITNPRKIGGPGEAFRQASASSGAAPDSPAAFAYASWRLATD